MMYITNSKIAADKLVFFGNVMRFRETWRQTTFLQEKRSFCLTEQDACGKISFAIAVKVFFYAQTDICGMSMMEVFNMASKAGARDKLTLACEGCKQRNYQTYKNKKNDPDRLELKKYCRFCQKHTNHKETK